MKHSGKAYPANQLKQMDKKIGFANLEPDLLKSVSVMGGKASHNPAKPKVERAHEWNSDTARQAALKRWASRRAKQAAQTQQAA